MAWRNRGGVNILLCLGILLLAISICHSMALSKITASNSDIEESSIFRGNSAFIQTTEGGTANSPRGRLFIGRNSRLGPTLKEVQLLNDTFYVDAEYQSDMGWEEPQHFKGQVHGTARPDSAAVQKLLQMEPKVECTGDSMKLKVQDSDSTSGSLFLVDRGSLLSPLPLSNLPSSCGYSLWTTRTDLILVAPYDGCFVTLEEESYVLPLRWCGLQVRMSCPAMRRSPYNPPTVSCNTEGMMVKMEWTSVDKIKVNLSGHWEPLMEVSPRCGFGVVAHPEGVVISIRYVPCMEVKEGMFTINLAGDGEIKVSCPTVAVTQPEPSKSQVAKNPSSSPVVPDGQKQHPFGQFPSFHSPPYPPVVPDGQKQHPFGQFPSFHSPPYPPVHEHISPIPTPKSGVKEPVTPTEPYKSQVYINPSSSPVVPDGQKQHPFGQFPSFHWPPHPPVEHASPTPTPKSGVKEPVTPTEPYKSQVAINPSSSPVVPDGQKQHPFGQFPSFHWPPHPSVVFDGQQPFGQFPSFHRPPYPPVHEHISPTPTPKSAVKEPVTLTEPSKSQVNINPSSSPVVPDGHRQHPFGQFPSFHWPPHPSVVPDGQQPFGQFPSFHRPPYSPVHEHISPTPTPKSAVKEPVTPTEPSKSQVDINPSSSPVVPDGHRQHPFGQFPFFHWPPHPSVVPDGQQPFGQFPSFHSPPYPPIVPDRPKQHPFGQFPSFHSPPYPPVHEHISPTPTPKSAVKEPVAPTEPSKSQVDINPSSSPVIPDGHRQHPFGQFPSFHWPPHPSVVPDGQQPFGQFPSFHRPPYPPVHEHISPTPTPKSAVKAVTPTEPSKSQVDINPSSSPVVPDGHRQHPFGQFPSFHWPPHPSVVPDGQQPFGQFPSFHSPPYPPIVPDRPKQHPFGQFPSFHSPPYPPVHEHISPTPTPKSAVKEPVAPTEPSKSQVDINPSSSPVIPDGHRQHPFGQFPSFHWPPHPSVVPDGQQPFGQFPSFHRPPYPPVHEHISPTPTPKSAVKAVTPTEPSKSQVDINPSSSPVVPDGHRQHPFGQFPSFHWPPHPSVVPDGQQPFGQFPSFHWPPHPSVVPDGQQPFGQFPSFHRPLYPPVHEHISPTPTPKSAVKEVTPTEPSKSQVDINPSSSPVVPDGHRQHPFGQFPSFHWPPHPSVVPDGQQLFGQFPSFHWPPHPSVVPDGQQPFGQFPSFHRPLYPPVHEHISPTPTPKSAVKEVTPTEPSKSQVDINPSSSPVVPDGHRQHPFDQFPSFHSPPYPPVFPDGQKQHPFGQFPSFHSPTYPPVHEHISPTPTPKSAVKEPVTPTEPSKSQVDINPSSSPVVPDGHRQHPFGQFPSFHWPPHPSVVPDGQQPFGQFPSFHSPPYPPVVPDGPKQHPFGQFPSFHSPPYPPVHEHISPTPTPKSAVKEPVTPTEPSKSHVDPSSSPVVPDGHRQHPFGQFPSFHWPPHPSVVPDGQQPFGQFPSFHWPPHPSVVPDGQQPFGQFPSFHRPPYPPVHEHISPTPTPKSAVKEPVTPTEPSKSQVDINPSSSLVVPDGHRQHPFGQFPSFHWPPHPSVVPDGQQPFGQFPSFHSPPYPPVVPDGPKQHPFGQFPSFHSPPYPPVHEHISPTPTPKSAVKEPVTPTEPSKSQVDINPSSSPVVTDGHRQHPFGQFPSFHSPPYPPVVPDGPKQHPFGQFPSFHSPPYPPVHEHISPTPTPKSAVKEPVAINPASSPVVPDGHKQHPFGQFPSFHSPPYPPVHEHISPTPTPMSAVKVPQPKPSEPQVTKNQSPVAPEGQWPLYNPMVHCPQVCPSGLPDCCPSISYHQHTHHLIPPDDKSQLSQMDPLVSVISDFGKSVSKWVHDTPPTLPTKTLDDTKHNGEFWHNLVSQLVKYGTEHEGNSQLPPEGILTPRLSNPPELKMPKQPYVGPYYAQHPNNIPQSNSNTAVQFDDSVHPVLQYYHPFNMPLQREMYSRGSEDVSDRFQSAPPMQYNFMPYIPQDVQPSHTLKEHNQLQTLDKNDGQSEKQMDQGQNVILDPRQNLYMLQDPQASNFESTDSFQVVQPLSNPNKFENEKSQGHLFSQADGYVLLKRGPPGSNPRNSESQLAARGLGHGVEKFWAPKPLGYDAGELYQPHKIKSHFKQSDNQELYRHEDLLPSHMVEEPRDMPLSYTASNAPLQPQRHVLKKFEQTSNSEGHSHNLGQQTDGTAFYG